MPDFNYFNYFTEIEEYFWRKRGAHLLVSPLDWAIVETWQKAGIPLAAALKGIDRAFESYGRSRRGATGRPLKSLAYCVDAVLEANAEAKEAASGQGPQAGGGPAVEPFSRAELRKYFERNAERLRAAAIARHEDMPALSKRLEETAVRLTELCPLLDAPGALDLEDLERRLTVLEDKLSATLAGDAGEDVLLRIREEVERALTPYRRKMDAGQIAHVERQYQQKRLYEEFRVPRLSLFYLT
jgi:hypothetical protein